jgi:hypothetical protein
MENLMKRLISTVLVLSLLSSARRKTSIAMTAAALSPTPLPRRARKRNGHKAHRVRRAVPAGIAVVSLIGLKPSRSQVKGRAATVAAPRTASSGIKPRRSKAHNGVPAGNIAVQGLAAPACGGRPFGPRTGPAATPTVRVTTGIIGRS